MAEETKIEWATHTFNPWIGCTKVAEGCTHCYAESYAKRYGKATWGPSGTRVKTSAAYWRQPLKWETFARMSPELGRPRVFCASLADVFEDWDGPIVNAGGYQLWLHPKDPLRPYRICESRTPLFSDPHPEFVAATMHDLRRDLFALIDATPHLDWLVLTKRPENIRRMWPIPANGLDPIDELYLRRDNVWLLTSIAMQADADKNIPELLKCRDLCPVLGVSAEPLVGPVDLTAMNNGGGETFNALTNTITTHRGESFVTSNLKPLDWVIVGGESGHGARPFNIQWARDIIGQCKAAGVPCFVKQLGAVPFEDDSHLTGAPIDKMNLTRLPGAAMKDKKGGDPAEWPSDLRVRDFPQPAHAEQD